MLRKRIPLAFTNANKLKAMEDFQASTESRSLFCREAGIDLLPQRSWERTEAELRSTCVTRVRALTVAGSGRVSESHLIEDALTTWVKNKRREELPVSRESIIRVCMRLLPGFLQPKSEDARYTWCDCCMKRSGLTIRRVSHSGRKTKEELMKFREAFALKVSTILITHFLDTTELTPPFVLYNMDQTNVYCHLGARSAVDFVGVKRVPCSLAGKGGYRCTVALTACAYGRHLAPHFVFKGKVGGGVEDEVRHYCDGETATGAVQSNAWFDERTMLDWIKQVWQFEVTIPSVLILDSLKIHQSPAVKKALVEIGTYPVYVPGECLSAA